MQHRFAALLMLLMLLACALPATLQAGGKASNKAVLSFHIETDENDNPKMIFSQMTNGKVRYFRRLPEVTTKDVASFMPFPTEGGEGYGIVFKLKDNASARLVAITNANQGRWLLAQLNGRIVDGVLIDKQINDGCVVIWKDVTLADVNLFDASLPRIGQDGKKKK